ncbi:MAG: peptidylprolyl isomerase [Gammaproteobacteria bacterium]
MKKTAILALSLLAAGCFHDSAKTGEGADSAQTSGGGEIVAVVNGAEISETRISVYAPVAGGQDRETILDNIITGEIIAQAARDAEMHLRPEIAEQLRIAEQTVLGRAYTQEFIGENPVAEATVSLRYEELKSDLSGRSEYRTAHILVDDEELAGDLHAQISADGGKFAELAQEHSKDPGSAARGGELGWTDSSALVPEYAAAMEQTKPGALAVAPVRTQFGWHIIRVDEKRPLTPPPLNDDLRHNIEQSVRAELFSVHLEELRAAAEIVRK